MFTVKRLPVAVAVAVCCAVILAGCSVRPDPIDYKTVVDTAIKDEELIYASQEPVTQALTLEEAMSRAVKYNLENRMQLMAQAMAQSSFDLVKMDMLPLLGLNAGYFDRSNVDASRSFNIISKQDNFSYSTSQDLKYSNADLNFSFGLLDFGSSYIQAKQEGNRFMISGQARRKVMMRLLQQTRAAYWRTVAMDTISGELKSVLVDAKVSLARLQKVRDEQLAAPQTTLQDIRALLELVQALETMEQSVNLAKIELSTLINAKPGSELFVYKPPELPKLPALPDDISDLELAALGNSTDYISELYNEKVDQLESRKALLRLIPGIEFAYGKNYQSNSYLYNDSWGTASVRVTGNLMRLVSGPSILRQNEAREQLGTVRRLTMNMAVITAVHLAWQQYENSIVKYDRAKELEGVDIELAVLTEQSVINKSANPITRIQNQARALRSTLAKLMSYAELQAAYGSFLTSMSLSPVPENYQMLDLKTLSTKLGDTYSEWDKGKIPGIDLEKAPKPAANGLTTVPATTINAAPPVAATTAAAAPVTVTPPAGVTATITITPNVAPAVANAAAAVTDTTATPVVATDTVATDAATPAVAATDAPTQVDADSTELLAVVDAWTQSWQSRDVDGYLAFYANDFRPAGIMSHEEWALRRRSVIEQSVAPNITVDNWELVERTATTATVKLRLRYHSAKYSDDTSKRLVLVKSNDGWRIQREVNLEIVPR